MRKSIPTLEALWQCWKVKAIFTTKTSISQRQSIKTALIGHETALVIGSKTNNTLAFQTRVIRLFYVENSCSICTKSGGGLHLLSPTNRGCLQPWPQSVIYHIPGRMWNLILDLRQCSLTSSSFLSVHLISFFCEMKRCVCWLYTVLHAYLLRRCRQWAVDECVHGAALKADINANIRACFWLNRALRSILLRGMLYMNTPTRVTALLFPQTTYSITKHRVVT